MMKVKAGKLIVIIYFWWTVRDSNSPLRAGPKPTAQNLVPLDGFEPSTSSAYVLLQPGLSAASSGPSTYLHNLPLFTWASLPFLYKGHSSIIIYLPFLGSFAIF